MEGCFTGVLAVISFIAFFVALKASSRASALRGEIDRLRETIDHLGRRLSELRLEFEKNRTVQPATEATSEPIAAKSETASKASVAQTVTPTSPAPFRPPFESQPTTSTWSVTAPTPPPPTNAVEPTIPVTPPLDLPVTPTTTIVSEAVAEPIGVPPPVSPADEPPVATPPPPIPPRPRPPVMAAATPKKPFDWESLVGVKLFSWIAGIALVLAAIFFLRYSVDHGWLSPTVRATIGLLTGIALLVVCELRIARDVRWTANAMDGAGIAILYATLFATHALWNLLPGGVVFALMLVVTAVAVLLSIRRDSIFIALLGLIGGFATPIMLSTGENAPIPLFGYLLLLNLGLAWVAHRKRWPLLTALSVGLTVFYQWGWLIKFLDSAQLPLAAGIFLVFAATAASALWIGRQQSDKYQRVFDRIAITGAALPLIFGVFMAAVPAYGERYNVLFGFLLLMAAGLAAIAIAKGPMLLHEFGASATLLTFVIWSAENNLKKAWPVVFAWIAAFILLYLITEVIATRLGRAVTKSVYVAAFLFFLFPALAATTQAANGYGLLFATLFLLLAAVAAYAIRYERGIVYFIASFFAIFTEAVWSSKNLDDKHLTTALVLYAVFAIFFLGVPALARRFHRALKPEVGIAVVLLLSLGMLIFLAAGSVASSALWGMALLLAILNIGTLIEARVSRHPVLAGVAMVLSWIVIAIWWSSAEVRVNFIPAMVVVAGFSMIVVGGSMWARRGMPESEADEFGGSTYLGLIGHLFLMFVASQPALAFPPWPLLGVLLVLDLAVGVASLYIQRGRLFVSAMVASQVMLLIWASKASLDPWPVVAIISAIAVAAFAMIWWALARTRFKVAYTRGGFVVAAAAAILLGQVVVGIVSSHASFALVVGAQTILIATILALAWITEWQPLALIAVPFAVLMATPWTNAKEELLSASILYALFLGYPLALGRRAKRSLYPYLAALAAGAAFFVFAYDAMDKLALHAYIGVLPVGQAILTLALVARLLQIEPRHERLLSRLALTAGVALAFITAAVPLQLEKQGITIAWALEGAALIWLFRRVPHRGLLIWSGALLGAVFVRLVFNNAVFSYHPQSHTAIFNWYLYSYAICAISFFLAAWLLPESERQRLPNAPAMLNGAGTILLFVLCNIEIADYYSTGPTLTFNFLSSSLAQDLTYTMVWALFAMVMLVVGIVMHTRAARVAALLLLLVTILKCFLHDLARLGGLYRVGSLLGLAISLVFVGVLLQKFVLVKNVAAPGQETP